MVVWRKLVDKRPRFGHFRAGFWPFLERGNHVKKSFRPSFFNFFFFVTISHTDSYEPKRTFCGGLREIGQ